MSDNGGLPSEPRFGHPEELQREPDEPRSPWLFRACLVGVGIFVGVLWWL